MIHLSKNSRRSVHCFAALCLLAVLANLTSEVAASTYRAVDIRPVELIIASQESAAVDDDYPDWEDDEVAQVRVRLDARSGEPIKLFPITLKWRSTLRFETVGAADTFGLLADERGVEIASDDNSGVDENFRLTVTLDPGEYLLGVSQVPTKAPASDD